MIKGNKREILTVFVTITMIFVAGSGLFPHCLVSARSSTDPIRFNIILRDFYRVGEQDIITLQVYDADDNMVENYTGTVLISVIKGNMAVDDANPYNFTLEDKGMHTFIVTPLTFGENSTTLLFEDQAAGIRENVTLSVIAGPVKTLAAKLDWDAMDYDGSNKIYYAGDDLFLTVYGMDGMGNPSSTYDAPIIVTHNFETDEEYLEPEPWQSSVGNIILNMVDGVASNYPDLPIKLFGTGEVNLTFFSQVNYGMNGSMIVNVNPSYLYHIEAVPGGSDTNPVTVDVKAGATQFFSVIGFDEYDNPLEMESVTWRVDPNIKAMDTQDILVDGEFKAIEFFGLGDIGVVYNHDIDYSSMNGTVEVTAMCPRDGHEVKELISVRVLNDKDVWLNEDQIEPYQILLGYDMEFQANIYYDMPVIDSGTEDQSSALGEIFEVTVIASLVDKDGNKLVELVNEQVRLEDLNSKPYGIRIINAIVPWENISEYIKKWEAGNDDTKNFIRLEIKDVLGGTDLSDFEKSGDNNEVISELYGVAQPNVQDPPKTVVLEEGLLNSSMVRFLFIPIGILLFLIILGVILAIIFKKEPATGNKEEKCLDIDRPKDL